MLLPGGNPWHSGHGRELSKPAGARQQQANKKQKEPLEWIVFDLGQMTEISQIRLHQPPNGWDGAQLKSFRLQTATSIKMHHR